MKVAHRFFCPDPPIEGRLVLRGDEARHLARVRRVGVGEVVEVFDGRGFASRAEVIELGKDRADLRSFGDPLADRVVPCRLTLATAVPKGDRFDWLVEKATELGVTRLIPILVERSVVDPREGKLDRLRRTIIEASKQCGRSTLMALERPRTWESIVLGADEGPRLLAHPGGLPASAWPKARAGGAVTLAIGPEGGFTEAELGLADTQGWRAIGLGPTRLRIETAGMAGLSMILALCEGNSG